MTASPAFRLDIQGLRALAVLLVFFSHAGWQPFGGGFIGVDVFFVISGYVITRYLLREHSEKGALSLRHFYARRLQRLLPALLFMVLVVGGYSMLFLTRQERAIQLDAAANALFWVSNLFFYFTQLDYFDSTHNANLFLHTWTLGVEEQFYLVWPLVLLAGLAAGGRRVLPALLVALVVLTLALCLYWAETDPNAAFYMMPARGWQFAIGGLVAWWHHSGGKQPGAALANIASLAGLALVLVAAILLDEHSAYPRLNALAPTLGTALVIAGGGWCNRLLASGPAVWLGNVSYGFYLWHWPILLVFADLQPFYPALTTGLALLATTLLAAASYYFVEQPLRTNSRLLARPRLVIGGALVAMLSAVLLVQQWMAAFLGNWGTEVAEIQRIAGVMPRPYVDECDDWYNSAEIRPCVYGVSEGEQTAVLVSDSVGLQWFPAIEAWYRARGWRLVVLTKSACPIVNRSYYYDGIRAQYEVCDRWREGVVRYIAEQQPQQLLIGSYGGYPFSAEDWRQGTAEILAQLSPRVGDILLLAPTPRLDFNGPLCLARQARLVQVMPIAPYGGCEIPLPAQPELPPIRAAAGQFGNVHWLDFSGDICPAGSCRARLDEVITYRDSHHLTEEFVLSLGPVVAERLGKR